MSVGIRYTEDHEDEDSEDAQLDRVIGVRASRSPDEPGSAYDFATTTVQEGEHGGLFHYVSLNTLVLGWVMERASGTPIPELISQEVWSHLDAEDDAYIALDGAGSAQLDGGFCASLRDLARFALMLGSGGLAGDRRVVPAWWMDEVAGGGDAVAFAASPDRGLLPSGSSYKDCFWVVRPGPDPCFLGLGMYGQVIFVDQGRDLVAVKFSSQVRAADELLLAHTYHALDSLAESLA